MTISLDLGAPSEGAGDLPDLPDLPALPDLPPLDDLPADVSADDSPSNGLTVRFKPDPELYESGNEPLFLMRTLADLGPCEIDLAFDAPDSFTDMAKPGGRIAWTIRIDTDQPPSAVHEVFEFATGLCQLEVSGNEPVPETDGP